MYVTLSGIVTDVILLQCANADDPMLVTLDGIVTDVNPLQSSNAEDPMLVTPSGIVTSPFTPRTSVFPSFDSKSPFADA